jgi:hypothetical protein
MNRLITARGPKTKSLGRRIWPGFVALVLAPIGVANALSVRADCTGGAPRLLVDGKSVRARMFFGIPGSAPIAVAAGHRQVTCLEGRTDLGGLARTAPPARSLSVVESRGRPDERARRPRPKGPPAHETRRHECPAVRIECGPIAGQTRHVTTPVRALVQTCATPNLGREADDRLVRRRAKGTTPRFPGCKKVGGPFRTDAGRTLGPEHFAFIDPICSPRTQERPLA